MEATQLAFISRGTFQSYSVAISSFTLTTQNSFFVFIPKTSFGPHLQFWAGETTSLAY